jgi:hypothetical protein
MKIISLMKPYILLFAYLLFGLLKFFGYLVSFLKTWTLSLFHSYWPGGLYRIHHGVYSFFIIELGGREYIVAFTKVLTMYQIYHT